MTPLPRYAGSIDTRQSSGSARRQWAKEVCAVLVSRAEGRCPPTCWPYGLRPSSSSGSASSAAAPRRRRQAVALGPHAELQLAGRLGVERTRVPAGGGMPGTAAAAACKDRPHRGGPGERPAASRQPVHQQVVACLVGIPPTVVAMPALTRTSAPSGLHPSARNRALAASSSYTCTGSLPAARSLWWLPEAGLLTAGRVSSIARPPAAASRHAAVLLSGGGGASER